MGRVRLAGQSPSLDLRQRLAAAEQRTDEQAMQIKSIFDFINYHQHGSLADEKLALQARVKFCDERIKQLELEIWELQNDD